MAQPRDNPLSISAPRLVLCAAMCAVIALLAATQAAASPPTATTGSVTGMTEDTATLNGTVNPGSLKTTYYFEYGTTTSYGTKTSEGTLEGAGSKEASKSTASLSFGVLYHYRIVATNGEGIAKGEDKVFTLRWAVQALPKLTSSILNGVSCPSPSACVAVGSPGLAVHWNGTEWKTVAVPEAVGSLADVSCTSPAACIAVGSSLAGALWNGTEWKAQTITEPLGGGTLQAVSCTSSTACTAVGTSKESPLVERLSGTEWKPQTVPSPEGTDVRLRDVSCSSSTECTAVGFYRNGASQYRPFAVRWNGTEWKLQTVPGPETGFRYLEGVSCISSMNCIAVGFDYVNSEPQKYTALAVHWDGTEWKTKSTPTPAGTTELTLTGVSCTSANTCIATGNYMDGAFIQKPLPMRWNGSEWLAQTAPEPEGNQDAYIHDVSCTFSTACTTVGFYHHSEEYSDLALRYFKIAAAPTVATKPATSVAEAGATLQGTVNPNGSATEYHFEYGTTTSYGSSTETLSAGSGETVVEVSKGISGLKPNTEYHYRIVASNENPKTSQGSDSTFVTFGPPTVTTGSAEPVFATGKEAKLNATVNPHGNSTTYQFEYGTSKGSYGSKAPVSPKSIGSGTTDQKVSETIAGLTPGVTYYYRATATNSAGTVNGSEQSFVAPNAPSAETQSAASIQAFSAFLQGKLITHGSQVKYWFEYGLTEAYGTKVPSSAGEASPVPEEKSVGASTLELEAATTYHYRLVAESPMGNAYGKDVEFTTKSIPPSALCKVHTGPTCGAGSMATTASMSLQAGTVWTLLDNLVDVLCLNVTSTITPLALVSRQQIHVTALALTNCGTSAAHNNCVITAEELPLLRLLHTGLNTGVLTALSGKMRIKCTIFGFIKLDCVYTTAGLQLEVKGGNPMVITSVKTPIGFSSGGLCPSESSFDAVQVSSAALYILE